MGDDLDFEAWYLAHHARMVASLVLTTGNADVARDAVDEAAATSTSGSTGVPSATPR